MTKRTVMSATKESTTVLHVLGKERHPELLSETTQRFIGIALKLMGPPTPYGKPVDAESTPQEKKEDSVKPTLEDKREDSDNDVDYDADSSDGDGQSALGDQPPTGQAALSG